MEQGKVWLVGAGPGDAELLTQKAVRVLQEADVIVYDALVGQAILAKLPEEADKIYVGKRSSNHAMPQEEISRCLVRLAKQGKNVVRLKGGDPFLFGRGGEEIEELIRGGIDYEVVPGVTSALAVPAYNGIPVTHRDYCSSLHIITGHKRQGQPLRLDYEALCRMNGTLVFLMGVAAAPEICRGLIDAGMDAQMPAALLSQGTTAGQRRLVSNVSELPQRMQEEKLPTPAILVIGKVCALAEEFAWVEKLPLAGTKVVLTRPRQRMERLAKRFRALGAEVLELPSIRICPISGTDRLQAALAQIEQYGWLVFTSPSGIDVFFERCLEYHFDIRRLSAVKIAVIGSGTARQLEQHGLYPNLIPQEEYSAAALGDALAKQAGAAEKILIARAEAGSPDLLARLQKDFIHPVDDIAIYRTEAVDRESENAGFDLTAMETLAEDERAVFVFTSASTVRGTVEKMAPDVRARMRAVCIGGRTGEEARRYGIAAQVAEQADEDSLVEAVIFMDQLQIHKGRPENETGRTETEIHVYDFLDKLDITYERIDHEPVETMEACQEIDRILAPAVVCKNLFLTNSREDQYYLLMMIGDKKFRSSEVAGQIGSTRLSFASAEKMQEYLEIKPGAVSVMGLMNDCGHHVELLVDDELSGDELLGCHPCVNTSSLRLRTKDVLEKFVPATGHGFRKVHISR